MNPIIRNMTLLLFVWLLMAGVCFGKQVYLQDGSSIECQNYWQRGDKVFVKINRDTVAEFATSEVDLQQTRKAPGNKLPRRPHIKTAATVKPTSATVPVAVPAAMPAAKPTAVKSPTPAPSPAPTPVAAAQPNPAQATPTDSNAPLDKAEQERRAKEAAALMVEAAQKKDPELMKKALEAQKNAMPQQGASQLKSLGITYLIVLLLLCLLVIASMWMVFEKAGEAGWKSLVPLYNLYILIVISGKPGWWFFLMLVPLVGLICYFLAMLSLAERFGRGAVFGIGLFFLPMVFFPLLAFGGPPAKA